MKHSIRYIQTNYYQGTGRGKSIQILRGMEIREYPYNRKHSHKLNLLTSGKDWQAKFYPTHIDVARVYPED